MRKMGVTESRKGVVKAVGFARREGGWGVRLSHLVVMGGGTMHIEWSFIQGVLPCGGWELAG